MFYNQIPNQNRTTSAEFLDITSILQIDGPLIHIVGYVVGVVCKSTDYYIAGDVVGVLCKSTDYYNIVGYVVGVPCTLESKLCCEM